MSFNVQVLNNKSAPEQVTKSVTAIATYGGTLKAETSIIDPVILLETSISTMRNANYIYIPEFNRYYYIKDIKSIRNTLIEVSAHVDVLMTYRTQIRANKALIKRSQKNYDLMLNDGSLKINSNPKITTKAFDPFITHTEFVLAVAGG